MRDKKNSVRNTAIKKILWYLSIGRNALIVFITGVIAYQFEATGSIPFRISGFDFSYNFIIVSNCRYYRSLSKCNSCFFNDKIDSYRRLEIFRIFNSYCKIIKIDKLISLISLSLQFIRCIYHIICRRFFSFLIYS